MLILMSHLYIELVRFLLCYLSYKNLARVPERVEGKLLQHAVSEVCCHKLHLLLSDTLSIFSACYRFLVVGSIQPQFVMVTSSRGAGEVHMVHFQRMLIHLEDNWFDLISQS
ncbi:hypothetical protein EJ110_NYTH49231 [Nymphaea thermarum]|nr:hypothetical protein EJ110_NYTH49231 [Nymphaea thermarum]